MARKSAGLLVYRRTRGPVEVLLVHPGGPFWARRDAGAWSVPKGELEADEDTLAAAHREFREETGLEVGEARLVPLRPVKQRSGKVVHAWAVEMDVEPRGLRSNTFSMEWPPRSGKQQEFNEVDRAEWFTLEEARRKILSGQRPLLDQLESLLAGPGRQVRGNIDS